MALRNRERVLRAIAHRAVDRTPIGELRIDDRVLAGLAGVAADALTLEQRCAALESLGCDIVVGHPDGPDGTRFPGAAFAVGRQDARRGRAGEGFGLPGADELDFAPLRALARETGFFTFMMLPGCFSSLAQLYGFTALLSLPLTDPAQARSLSEAMADYGIALGRRAAEAGADGLIIGDDIAWSRGLYVRPQTFRAVFLPALAREVQALKGLGLPVFFHSDGNIAALLPDLVQAGVDGLHPLEPAAGMDLGETKRSFGRELCLWGNLDVDGLQFASDGELEREVGRVLEMGGATGFIFGSSSGEIGAAVPVSRVRRICEMARRPCRR